MRKTLIAYHSRSGYTRRVAESLPRRLRADVDEIEVVGDRQGMLGYARCALEAIGEVTTAIRLSRRAPAEYDLVVIGTPVWFWALSSPVRSYNMEERRNFPRVALRKSAPCIRRSVTPAGWSSRRQRRQPAVPGFRIRETVPTWVP